MNAGDLLDTRQAIDLARRTRESAARYELLGVEAATVVWIGRALFESGDWERAKETILDLVPPGNGLMPAEDGRAQAVLARIEARTGGSRAADLVVRSRFKAEESGQPQIVFEAARAVAEYLWATGADEPDALGWVRAAFERCLSARWPWTLGSLSYWLWELGHLTSIPEDAAEPYRLTYRGDVAAAAAIWEAKGFPYERGLALMHGSAGECLEALRVFEDLGATVAADRVRRTLRSRGVAIPRRASRSTRDHPLGLTTRQAEVLELLADDLTNTEIADRLFISSRTVDSHVAAILTKLDVADRRAAVAAARERGILPAP